VNSSQCTASLCLPQAVLLWTDLQLQTWLVQGMQGFQNPANAQQWHIIGVKCSFKSSESRCHEQLTRIAQRTAQRHAARPTARSPEKLPTKSAVRVPHADCGEICTTPATMQQVGAAFASHSRYVQSALVAVSEHSCLQVLKLASHGFQRDIYNAVSTSSMIILHAASICTFAYVDAHQRASVSL
jgi:hypothetical protein